MLQEISYGQLLVPSRQFQRDKKLNQSENEAMELTHFIPNKHHVVQRCLETNIFLSIIELFLSLFIFNFIYKIYLTKFCL